MPSKLWLYEVGCLSWCLVSVYRVPQKNSCAYVFCVQFGLHKAWGHVGFHVRVGEFTPCPWLARNEGMDSLISLHIAPKR